MKKLFQKTCFLAGIFFIFAPNFSFAREIVTDWYIQNFDLEIVVNNDSSLLITEKITADCGNLPDKHGIFRVLPTVWKTTDGEIRQPVELVSITDFNGKNINYQTIKDGTNDTITWKIGDADKTVQGVNNYKITYKVKNVIVFKNPEFDEWYWNLTGNFWDIEIEKFHAKIIFPEEIDKNQSEINYYTGRLGVRDNSLARYEWVSKNILEVFSNGIIYPKNGITFSVTFPKNIFIPYQPTFWEKWSWTIIFILPALAFWICFLLWRKYGKDPCVDKTIIPEFGVPENVTPVEMGMILSNGSFDNKFISASIINLAVKKIINIQETEEKILFWNSKDLKINLIDKNALQNADPVEKFILEKMLSGKKSVAISSLKNNFSSEVQEIENKASENIENKKWVNKAGMNFKIFFIVLSIAMAILSFFLFGGDLEYTGWGLLFSALIIFIFAFVMPQRTPTGAELLWKIKGFKLYMETAEKYRQQFNEKENIFEKFLPYAMVFGMTKLWIKKMKEIYGEEYFRNYHPIWYVGAGNFTSFDVDSFTSKLDSISTSIASSTSSGSGSGGSGGSGGGGGGGGGGGW